MSRRIRFWCCGFGALLAIACMSGATLASATTQRHLAPGFTPRGASTAFRAECKAGTVCVPEGKIQGEFRITGSGSGCDAEWLWGDGTKTTYPNVFNGEKWSHNYGPRPHLYHASLIHSGTCGSGTEDFEIEVPRVVTEMGAFLSGDGKEAESITVPKGTGVTEHAVLFGEEPFTEEATGTVTYTVYSEPGCKHELTKAGSFTLSGKSGEMGAKTLPNSEAETLNPGKYYWKVAYTGDEANTPTETCKAVETVETATAAPSVETTKARELGQTTATLTAQVNPNLGTVTKCTFEYGTTNKYGSTVQCAKLPGSGASSVEVDAAIKGLKANTSYHFRISATNSAGTSKGADGSFKTAPALAPSVETTKARELGQTTATLTGEVDPNLGTVTKCTFEYGTTNKYGSTVQCAKLPGSGASSVEVDAAIKGLKANTSYHFRISATNSAGTSKGADESFKTAPALAPSVETTKARELGQTTATLTGEVDPNLGTVTKCTFEYGTTNKYGSTVQCAKLPGSGASSVEVDAAIKGLKANTSYHFRISATNSAGTSKGADESLKSLAASAPTAPTSSSTSSRGAWGMSRGS